MRQPSAARAATTLLGLLLALTACSTVPASSPTVQITQAPTRPVEEVGIEPVSPAQGGTPEEIVRSFIDAAASVRAGHPIAREHLTPEAAGKWSDEAGITVISPNYATVTTESGAVEVSAPLVGTVDERGVFSVGDAGTFTREFTLQQVKGQWRISNPPDGLVILRPDFERLYDQRAAYFLDSTGQRMVPDPRYLIIGQAQPTALVQRLLDGPSAVLAPGVRNPLAGVQLRNAVTVTGQAAVVDLTALATDPGPRLSAICAQLVWTLTDPQLRIRTVEVRVDGVVVRLPDVSIQQSTDDWASFDPAAVPVDAVGHYLSAGALHTAATGAPIPGPAGSGVYALASAAVSAEPRKGALTSIAGVRADPGGAALLAGPYDGELSVVFIAGSITAPTVAATRSEFWVVRDGTSVVRLPAGAAPQPVSAPTLPGLGVAQVLRLSPDGVRAALIVDGPGGSALYVSTVVRAEDGGVGLRDLRPIAPSLSRVVDVAWRDSGELLVLARDGVGDGNQPYSLGVDGWGLSALPTAGLPLLPASIAAAPTRPALVSAGGTIWQLNGGTWATLVRGREPLPGIAPFYPL